ncbi:polysaccharide biosynthesis/export family protein [Sphingomonas sp. BIUV-7]|uniref:Polysaccharide biosynthesis/export family protein n=1 Tax=Sphingomonas natans TaxID=3063330 RepID=A0ABT8YCS7_9SPHN|nr:polysaccharide biosynthesis/export family protein [Sphingomonas sp. BIUV-7]MDO6416161.1 polysaccharide biosynthesis/export family protein [Sphingomonas sp. BIUV-7]
MRRIGLSAREPYDWRWIFGWRGWRDRGTIAVCAAAAICAPISSEPTKPTPLPADTAYRLSGGDRLRVTVFGEPALTGDYSITADGILSFPLIGEIDARGRSIGEVREALRERLGKGYVNDPRVAIEAISYRPYYVLGEVNRPGEYPYAAGLRVDQAIAAAGGFTYRANRGTAFVRSSDDSAERKVKLRKRPVSVLPGDTIRVGERYL